MAMLLEQKDYDIFDQVSRRTFFRSHMVGALERLQTESATLKEQAPAPVQVVGNVGKVEIPPDERLSLLPRIITVNDLIEQLREATGDRVAAITHLLFRLQALLKERLDLPYRIRARQAARPAANAQNDS